MLKIVKTSIAIAATSIVFAAPVQADVAEALQNICTIVKADDKSELRKKMKRVQSDYRLKLQDYYTGSPVVAIALFVPQCSTMQLKQVH